MAGAGSTLGTSRHFATRDGGWFLEASACMADPPGTPARGGLSPEMMERLDPFLPIAPGAGKPSTLVGGARRSQRVRRSEILATIRRLLTEVGCHELTV